MPSSPGASGRGPPGRASASSAQRQRGEAVGRGLDRVGLRAPGSGRRPPARSGRPRRRARAARVVGHHGDHTVVLDGDRDRGLAARQGGPARGPGPRRRRWRRAASRTHGTKGSQMRSTSALDIPLRSASATTTSAPPTSNRVPVAPRPRPADCGRRPYRECECGEVADRRSRSTGGGPRRRPGTTHEGRGSGPRTIEKPRQEERGNPSTAAADRANDERRRAEPATADRPIGITANSTGPFDERRAATPKRTPPARAKRVGVATASRPVERGRRAVIGPGRDASEERVARAPPGSRRRGRERGRREQLHPRPARTATSAAATDAAPPASTSARFGPDAPEAHPVQSPEDEDHAGRVALGVDVVRRGIPSVNVPGGR